MSTVPICSRKLPGIELQVGHVALDIRLSPSFNAFSVERLDDSDALDDVEDVLTHRLMSAKNTPSSPLHPFRLNIGDPEVDRHDAKCHETHIDIRHEHQHQCQDGAGEKRKNLDKEIVDRVAEAHDAPVDTRLQFSRLITL